MEMTAGNAVMHAGACRKSQHAAVERHDAIVEAIHEYIKELHPGAEIAKGNAENSGTGNYIVDLISNNTGIISKYDVGVTHAALLSNAPAAGHTKEYTSDTSARAYEQEKRLKYRHADGSHMDVTPLIMLSTGKPGPILRAELEQLNTSSRVEGKEAARRRLQQRFVRACAIHDARSRIYSAANLVPA